MDEYEYEYRIEIYGAITREELEDICEGLPFRTEESSLSDGLSDYSEIRSERSTSSYEHTELTHVVWKRLKRYVAIELYEYMFKESSDSFSYDESEYADFIKEEGPLASSIQRMKSELPV